jgi:hypothetical protein
VKSGTTGLLKFSKLKRALGLTKWQAVGVLQTLWEFAGENAPRGDIGRYSDEDIAFGIEWEGDAAALIAALVENAWLDRDAVHRLIVHDWADHLEERIRKRLLRSGQAVVTPCPISLSDNGRQRQTTADNGRQRQPTRAGARVGLPVPNIKISAEINQEKEKEMPNPDQGDSTKGRERPLEKPLKKILGTAVGDGVKQAEFRAELLARLDVVAQDGDGWGAWWLKTVNSLGVDGLLELERLVEYAEQCGNPTVRKLKGLGALKKPGAFMASRLLKWARGAKVSLPEPPEAAKNAPRAGSAGKQGAGQGETAPRTRKSNLGHPT